MGGIVFFVFVGIAILSSLNKASNQKSEKAKTPNTAVQQMKRQNQTDKEVKEAKVRQQQRQAYERAEQEKARLREEERAKEKRRREIKEREERMKKRKEEEERKGDILERSNVAVAEDFDKDELKKDAGQHENCSIGHYEESPEFMQKVQDLMVMGPNCTISYERDFVAEGEQLISSFGKAER